MENFLPFTEDVMVVSRESIILLCFLCTGLVWPGSVGLLVSCVHIDDLTFLFDAFSVTSSCFLTVVQGLSLMILLFCSSPLHNNSHFVCSSHT